MRVPLLLAVAAVALACAGPACSAKKPPATVGIAIPPPQPPAPSPSARLDAANKLLSAGCLDCLLEANQRFEELRDIPSVADPATDGAIESAALITLRERSLAMVDTGHLQRARALAAGSEDLQVKFGIALDAIEATGPRIGRIVSEQADADILRRARVVQQNGPRWIALLSTTADDDPFWAVVWVSFSCSNSPTAAGRARAALVAPLTVQKDAPAVVWELATCGNLDAEVVQKLAAADPRFHEADYWLAFGQLRRADLDDAQVRLTRAYEWHPDWPSASVTIGSLFMTSEDFEPALQLYEKTLALLPGLADGMIGRVKALGYLGRHDEAIAGANAFIKSLPGDAYYWRAWNENQLDQIEPAWTDVEEAYRLQPNNSEVAKLGGLVAYRRHQLEIARDRFVTSRRINPDDCDAAYFLGAVQAELKAWGASVDAYLAACTCLDGAIGQFQADIVRLQASNASPERKAFKIAGRERKIALAEREKRQSWFNLSADNFNLQKFAEARQYAEKVMDDEQFGERARGILDALKVP